MPQLVARARGSTLLFRDHAEARALWDLLLRFFPEALALVLMPTHIHLYLPHADPDDRLTIVMRGYALWRNHHRGETGPVWAAHPEVRLPKDKDHARRLQRYSHLNPCRAKLVRDPLTWPWSLHREQVGLGPPGRTNRDPEGLHTYVSSDDSARTIALPTMPYRAVTWRECVEGACGVLRVPASALEKRGPARTLALKTAWAHGLRDANRLAEWACLDRTTVVRAVEGIPERGGKIHDPLLEAAMRVVGDPRFKALEEGDLRRRWRGSWYDGLS